jgi:Zn-dependent peptidase ImmA (M78 family)
MDARRIRREAQEALQELFRRRYDFWTDPPSDVEMIEPERILQIQGIRFLEPVEIRHQNDLAELPMLPSYAGYMDPQTKTIAVSRNLRPEVRRFTIAHELGHYILHRDQGILFRDRPVSGAEREDRHRKPEEKEADLFAAELLIPDWLVRREFVRYFGVQSFRGVRLDENVAFHLSTAHRKVTAADLNQRSRRYFSLLLADSRPWGVGADLDGMPTFCGLFRVSKIAMAIQLESLRLV